MSQLRKRILILTEGGKKSGFGHITRCVSIGNVFHAKGFKVSFIVYGDCSIKSALKGFKYSIVDCIGDFYKNRSLIKNNLVVLIDSIQISKSEILKISDLNNNVIHIDDEKQYNIINNGFILDWTINRANRFISDNRKKNVIYLIGGKYTPLRQEFYSSPRYIVNNTVKKILVTFGGSDVRNITPKILKFLVDNFKDIEKTVVIGSGCKNIENIKKIADVNTSIVFDASAELMVKNMHNNDMAIASGGQTLYELAKIGIPTIAIVLVDNAVDDTIGWEDVGFLKNIGWYNDECLLEKLNNELRILQDKKERKKMSEIGLNLMQGNGAKLIVDSVLKEIDDTI
jgi:spore coat polysaccharide biosynthesis predicted glycosyltransferase SpsG